MSRDVGFSEAKKSRSDDIIREAHRSYCLKKSESGLSQLEKRYIWLRDQATLHNRLNTVIRLLGLDSFFHEWEFDKAIDEGMKRLEDE